jgi:phenylalanyl-tRNA synthetase alpha chain
MASEEEKKDIKTELLESLSPDERLVLPCLEAGNIEKIKEKTGLEEVKIIRSLQFLDNKGVVKLKVESKKIVDLDENGVIYLKNGLPERRLLNLLAEKPEISLKEAEEKSKLSENEFKVALGTLKDKASIELKEGKLLLKASLDEIAKKSLEEFFIEALPLEQNKLSPEQLFALENLKLRKNIIGIKDKKEISFELTEIGKELVKEDLSKLKDLIETLTPEMILKESWKGKRFRKYDIKSPVPAISGGKRHFVNQAIDYARKIWTELGFKEMTGSLVQTGFWNFDALFTAQDHPVREIHDTFYIKDIKGKLPDKKIVERVKKSHESGVAGSRGWQYKWKEDEAKRIVLRTHTTCLSAQTLAGLKEVKDKTGKFFAVGMCFRNETVDANHGFEFNQTEGIVIDKNANFRHLLGYLKAFLEKMGFKKIRFRPHFFPYTEPSVEADVYNEKTGKWIEVLGAGIFRPEVVVPLLGEYIPVLAWGMGFDRLVKENYGITDLREMYKNDIEQLRKIKIWAK